MARYALSPAAQSDLESIWDCSLRHCGEAHAETSTRSIQAACAALAKGTSAGRSAEAIRAGYRKLAGLARHVVPNTGRRGAVHADPASEHRRRSAPNVDPNETKNFGSG